MNHRVPGQRHEAVSERLREDERERIARDLHDDLGSRLTAIKMALAQLGAQVDTRAAAATAAALQAQVRYADQLVDDAIGAMHDIIDDLHPAVLDLGLSAALEWLAKISTRQTGIPHRLLDDDLPPALLDSFQTVSLYRIAREALHNAGRHAAARAVNMRLHRHGQLVIMEIVDDGVGLPVNAAGKPESSGLRGMQRRAAAIGAALRLQAADGGGVKLCVEVPVLSAAKLI